jgi:hypothetical protein
MVIALGAAVVVAGSVAVGATSGGQRVNPYGARALNRQTLGIISTSATTSRTNWQAVPNWGFSDGPWIQARSALSATLSVTVAGGPAAFKVVLEVGKHFVQRGMNPPVVFNPGTGTESFSYTFVASLPPSGETFNLYWRSPTGVPVTLRRGTVVLQYDQAR